MIFNKKIFTIYKRMSMSWMGYFEYPKGSSAVYTVCVNDVEFSKVELEEIILQVF